MLRNLYVRLSIVAATVFSLAMFGAAPATADTVEGEITHVELHDTPRHIMVRSGGNEVQVKITNRTSVDFAAADETYFSPELSSLRPGMNVRATFDPDQPARRVSVLSVPPDQRREALRKFEEGRSGTADAGAFGAETREMKVRLLDINRDRGTFRADVAGNPRTFRADTPRMLARFDEGDLVVVTVDPGDRTQVTDIRSASKSGRIVDIDRTAGRVRVDVEGREEVYKVGRTESVRLREGRRIRFEFEERPDGERVITNIEDIR